jgi:hypothetical protein
MQYSVQVFKDATQIFRNEYNTCREVTLGYTVSNLKKNNITSKNINEHKVVFLIKDWDYNYNNQSNKEVKERKELFLKFIKFFSERFIRQCSVANQFSLEPYVCVTAVDFNENNYKGVTYGIETQGFVLQNPYFLNFFLGCIRSFWNYLVKADSDITALKSMKTYTEMLKHVKDHSSNDYPVRTDFLKKRKSLFLAFSKEGFLDATLESVKPTVYGATPKYNGFQTWYDGEGKLLLEEPKPEAAK